MDKDIIIYKIISEAEAEAKSMIDEVKAKIEKEAQENVELLNENKEKRLREINKRANQIRENAVSMAQLKARNMILTQKQKIIQETKNKITDILTGLDGKEYVDFIMEILRKSNLMELENAGIILPPKQRTEVITELGGKFKILNEETDFESGFIVVKDNVQYNFVLDTILEMEKETFDQILVDSLLN